MNSYAALTTYLAGGRNPNERPTHTKSCRVFRDADNSIRIRMYSTNILTFYPDGRVTLRADGWDMSVTTRMRFNEFLPDGWSVASTRTTWGSATALFRGGWNGDVFIYRDGLTIDTATNRLTTEGEYDAERARQARMNISIHRRCQARDRAQQRDARRAKQAAERQAALRFAMTYAAVGRLARRGEVSAALQRVRDILAELTTRAFVAEHAATIREQAWRLAALTTPTGVRAWHSVQYVREDDAPSWYRTPISDIRVPVAVGAWWDETGQRIGLCQRGLHACPKPMTAVGYRGDVLCRVVLDGVVPIAPRSYPYGRADKIVGHRRAIAYMLPAPERNTTNEAALIAAVRAIENDVIDTFVVR